MPGPVLAICADLWTLRAMAMDVAASRHDVLGSPKRSPKPDCSARPHRDLGADSCASGRVRARSIPSARALPAPGVCASARYLHAVGSIGQARVWPLVLTPNRQKMRSVHRRRRRPPPSPSSMARALPVLARLSVRSEAIGCPLTTVRGGGPHVGEGDDVQWVAGELRARGDVELREDAPQVGVDRAR